jgi:transcriptional regulator with XRE-family HTH domain
MVSNKPRGRGRPRASENALSKWIDGSGRTREQVAKALGVTKSSLDRYCRGERTPTLGAALAIEKVTGGAIRARSWLRRSSRQGVGHA